ncbi:biotin transport system substrate-specific component [Stackebrandtia albiflava]|uniref:Biotin transporter n=1 Tax=Stackebrandtia albiflava TaxID=406432 RepID=A0A562UQX5_9ACTN|nr:biotin transporter BioY [Stackebrandtia albiflava]TWJ08007.1 biotin transport system substrate-specific component [Stackebrandtia albiflava]
MTTHSAAVAPRQVLADLIPAARLGVWARDAILVGAGAALVGVSAQVAVPIPAISPVPFALSTLTVLLVGAALGPIRGILSMGLYLAAGAAGMPWFAEAESGVGIVSLGYIVGYIAAAALVGEIAKRGGDRTVLRTAGIMIAGNLAIYAFGVPYLVLNTGMSWTEGLAVGVVPFLITDAIKVLIAAALLPGTWRLVTRFRR